MTATCRSCEAPIVWARTTAGKSIPLDGEDVGGRVAPLQVEGGNLEDTGERAQGPGAATLMVVRTVSPGAIERGYRSHFATCPQSREWRKR